MRTHTIEVWKAIVGYEGLYEVSNYGRVKSVDRYVESTSKNGKQYMKHVKEKILRQTPNNRGYLEVTLYKNGVQNPNGIHVLVAEAFIPNTHGYEHVHHIDHNPLNNHVENLQWISKEDHEAMHGVEKAELLSKTVYQYTRDKLLVNVWKSTAQAADTLGFSNGNISSCCNNKYLREGNNIYKGYKWSYSPL